MRRFTILLLTIVLALLVCLPSQAGVVRVWGDRFDTSIISDFYASYGHDSTVLPGPLDSAALAGVNLLWAVQPGADYTPSELDAMGGFLGNGGRIAFMGEHGSYAPNENNRISAAIAALGGHISIVNLYPDSGFRDASKLDGQILNHSLTEGVDIYNYACFAPLIISNGAQKLMLGEDDPTQIMMAYENVGGGSIFLITDQNVWDNVYSASNNNSRMFLNLLNASTDPTPTVPEPASFVLVGAGVAAVALIRRRRA